MEEKIKPIIFYISLFLLILAFGTTATNYDYDLWARLIVGMNFIKTGHVLKQDFLSYTPTHTWYDHEWGSGVVFYLTQHLFSYAGIIILQTILIFLTFVFVVKTVKLRGIKTTSAYNFLFYYISFLSISYLIFSPIRCHLFSFLFFSIFLYILELSRNNVNKPLVLLPFLMLIWNNLHGGCVAGIGLIIIYIIGEFLNKKPIKKYLYSLIATIAALPINPWGFEYINFLFHASTMQRKFIVEWWNLFSQPFTYKYIEFKLFAITLVLLEFGLILKHIKDKTFYFDKTKFLLLITTLYLSIMHVKLIPFAVISIICFLYDDFYTIFNSITKNTLAKIAMLKESFVYFIIIALSCINITKIFKPLIDFTQYPVLAVEFIKVNKMKGNILTNFGLGSYVGYKLYPQNKIFMDGRYEEVYDDELMQKLQQFHLAKKNWKDILKEYPTDLIIIEKFYPIYPELLKLNEWENLFEDKRFVLFIKKEKMKKSYQMPSSDIRYYQKTVFETNINF